MPNTTQFERQPYSITSYSVNSGLTEWIKTVPIRSDRDKTLHSNITHLQNALQQISSWMTANLLTLNSSKTEFLLIGLKQQLSKIHNSSLPIWQTIPSIHYSISKIKLAQVIGLP